LRRDTFQEKGHKAELGKIPISVPYKSKLKIMDYVSRITKKIKEN
jgi:hypothetical protein